MRLTSFFNVSKVSYIEFKSYYLLLPLSVKIKWVNVKKLKKRAQSTQQELRNSIILMNGFVEEKKKFTDPRRVIGVWQRDCISKNAIETGWRWEGKNEAKTTPAIVGNLIYAPAKYYLLSALASLLSVTQTSAYVNYYSEE